MAIPISPLWGFFIEAGWVTVGMRELRVVQRSWRDIAYANRGDTMLTASELARLLNVHINTVRRWSNRGILKAYRVGPRGDRRFSREDVDNFLAENLEVNRKSTEKQLSLSRR